MSTDTKILAIDNGFGDNKIVFGPVNAIERTFKFNSVVGAVKSNPLVKDSRVYNYRGNSYYVGELALSLEANKIIDMNGYPNLELFSPLFIKYAIDQIGEVPTIIVCGLSIAHITSSGHYTASITNYLKELGYECQVEILPQGIGGKKAIDYYGVDFPNKSRQFSEGANYIGVDIGFNTIDVFQVLEGKTSSNLIVGIESQGLVRVVSQLKAHIKETYAQDFPVKQIKEVLDKGYFKVRGETYDVSAAVSEYKDKYLSNLETLIEKEFGSILDRVDNMYLFGGGSYFFQDKTSSYLQVPKRKAEYYNAIGSYLRGVELTNHKGA